MCRTERAALLRPHAGACCVQDREGGAAEAHAGACCVRDGEDVDTGAVCCCPLCTGRREWRHWGSVLVPAVCGTERAATLRLRAVTCCVCDMCGRRPGLRVVVGSG